MRVKSIARHVIPIILLVFSLNSSVKAYEIDAKNFAKQEIARLIDDAIRFHGSRDYPLAISSFKRALELDPQNEKVRKNLSVVHNNYGKYLAERTDPHGAITEFRNSLFYDPNNDVARSNLKVKIEATGGSATNSAIRVRQAKEEVKKGNLFAAITELNEANKVSESSSAYQEIGDIYRTLFLKEKRKQEFLDKSQEAFDRALAIDPKNIDAMLDLSELYIAKGSINLAIEECKKALATDPESIKAQEGLIEAWLAALRAAPHIASNHVGLATAYQIRGSFDQAERGFIRALELDPKNAIAKEGLTSIKGDKLQSQIDIYLNRAIKLQREGNFDASIAEYLKAVNLDPENSDIHYNIGTAFEAKKDFARAKKAYNRTLSLKPDHNEAKLALENLGIAEKEKLASDRFNKAISLHEIGDYKGAIDLYSKMAVDNPEDDTTFYNLGAAFQALGDYDRAIKSYKKANKLKADNKYLEAISYAEADQVNSVLNDAINAQNNGDNQAAIENYSKVLELQPGNASAWYNLGTAYQAANNNSRAFDAYMEASKLDPAGQSDAIFFAALIKEDEKKYSEAIDLYGKYRSSSPNGSYVRDSKERSDYLKSLL